MIIRMLGRTAVFVTALAAIQPGHAAWSDDWSRDQAVAELQALVLEQTPMDKWPQRNEKIESWIKRLEETGLRLQDRDYCRGVALYFLRKYDASVASIRDYFKTHDQLPDHDFDRLIGRILLTGANQAIADDNLKLGQTDLDRCLGLYDAPMTVYGTVGRQLRTRDDDGSVAMLNRLLSRALSDNRISGRQKQELLAGLYGPRRQRQARPGPARELKPFTAVDIDGRKIDLADYRGKVVLVDFWATWCGPCIREMPHVVKAYKKYKDRGFEVIAISLDQEPGQKKGGPILEPKPDGETVRKIRRSMKKLEMTWPCIYEGGQWATRLAKENGIRSIPATFLIDRDGKVRFTNLRGPRLGEKIAELLRDEGDA